MPLIEIIHLQPMIIHRKEILCILCMCFEKSLLVVLNKLLFKGAVRLFVFHVFNTHLHVAPALIRALDVRNLYFLFKVLVWNY